MTESKLKFDQITRGEICCEGLKQKKIQITRTESKKKYYTEEKPKMTYITISLLIFFSLQ